MNLLPLKVELLLDLIYPSVEIAHVGARLFVFVGIVVIITVVIVGFVRSNLDEHATGKAAKFTEIILVGVLGAPDPATYATKGADMKASMSLSRWRKA